MAGEFPVIDVAKHIREHEILGIAIGISNPFNVTWEQALTAGATATTVPIIDPGLKIGTDLTAQTHLELHGKTSGPQGQRRGGSMAFYDNDDAAQFYMYLQDTGENWQIAFAAIPEATSTVAVFKLDIVNGDLAVLGGFSFRGTLDWRVETDGTLGVQFDPVHVSTSPAVGDRIFSQLLKGKDSGGSDQEYAQISANIVDPTALSDDGELTLSIVSGGSLNNLFALIPGATNQVAIPADIQFCFDATLGSTIGANNTAGNTYYVYDSGASTLDCFVDATEVWNASTTKMETEVELVDRNRPVLRYALLAS